VVVAGCSGILGATIMIQGIILAAGLSTRMGRPKLLISLHGSPLLTRVLQAALESTLDRVILVSGPTSALLTDIPGFPTTVSRLQIVSNPHPEMGMSSSLRTGIAEIDPKSLGVMVILADQPWLTHRVIDDLVAAFMRDTSKIVTPAIDGRRTTPVVFPADLLDELLIQCGDVGGRNVMIRNVDKVVQIEMGSCYDDTDIDTPEDLKRAENRTSDRLSYSGRRDEI
jgi:molybdenum cofactor cytidylyltransferase